LLPEEDPQAAGLEVALTVSSAGEVARIDAAGRAAGRPLDIHLKIDTGMGRLGVWHEEIAPLYAQIRAASHVRLAGVFTHFSSPDDDAAFTREQRRRLLAALARCPVLGRVTMDQTIVDVPGVACGDTVVLVGRQEEQTISLSEFSRWADTIPWETLCSVTKRVPRVYRTPLGV
jgi:alanine racemase